MSLAEQIQMLNRTEDATRLRRLVERLSFRRLRDGTVVCLTYRNIRDIFKRCGVDESRFEELMQIADGAP